MALSKTTFNISKFFDESLTFLKEYEWIYNYPNTDVVVEGVFEKIPKDWKFYFKSLEHIGFRDIALHQPKDDCPYSLKKMLFKIQDLNRTSNIYEKKNSSYNFGRNCGLSIKKQHEIVSLAPVVAEICEETNSREVIDIGAGLGYLSYLLAEKHNLSVLAIEGCAEKIELATKARKKFHHHSTEIVTFHHHFITEGSFDEIREAIEKKFSDSDKISICGLHACADLSAVILDLFLKLIQIKSLVIMPCCYHRLKIEKYIGDEEYFSNFPLSDLLKSQFEKHNAAYFLRRPFLRLSCQQAVINFVNMGEKDHFVHAENFLRRAVLQQAAKEVGCDILRLKRKTGKARGEMKSFDFYLENLNKTHKLIPKNTTVNPLEIGELIFKKKMLKIYENEKEDLLLFAALTALQNAIQNICENILLQDRVQYLKENGVNCTIRKITDDEISPRCHALIAIKK